MQKEMSMESEEIVHANFEHAEQDEDDSEDDYQ